MLLFFEFPPGYDYSAAIWPYYHQNRIKKEGVPCPAGSCFLWPSPSPPCFWDWCWRSFPAHPPRPAPARQTETPVREEPQPPQEPKSPAGYLLRSYEGRLAVFRQGCDTPELIFDVYTRLLPPADRDRLETGISAPDYETLTRLIEDYIS